MPPDGPQSPANPTRTENHHGKPKPAKGKWARFLKELSRCGNVSAACRVSKLDRSDAYSARADNSNFALLWERAVETGLDRQEEEADRRATVGTRRLLLARGEPVRLDKAEGEHVDGWIESKDTATGEGLGWGFVYVLEYSDPLLVLLLKAGRPDKFADRRKLEAKHTGELGVAVSRTMADAMAAVRAERAAKENGETLPPVPEAVAVALAAAVSAEEGAENLE